MEELDWVQGKEKLRRNLKDHAEAEVYFKR